MKNLIFIAFLVFSNFIYSQNTITVSFLTNGDWTKDFSAADISGAGNNYLSSYESSPNQTYLSVNAENINKWLIVYVKRDKINWHNNLILKVKRTSNGWWGNASNISGGTIFQPISETSSNFFNLRGDFYYISLQYEITGISVLLPVKTYSTTVTYTVMAQ